MNFFLLKIVVITNKSCPWYYIMFLCVQENKTDEWHAFDLLLETLVADYILINLTTNDNSGS
jgi:hypothetical protein